MKGVPTDDIVETDASVVPLLRDDAMKEVGPSSIPSVKETTEVLAKEVNVSTILAKTEGIVFMYYIFRLPCKLL